MRKSTEQITREDIRSYVEQLRCVLFCMKVLMPDLKVAYLIDPWGKKVKIVNTYHRDSNEYKTKREKKMDEYEDYISMLEAEIERIGQEIDKQMEDI